MTLAFPPWLGRLLLPARPVPCPPNTALPPLTIEVQRLPDYHWRALGFRQPLRNRGE